MDKKYNVIIQFADEPLKVFYGFSIDEALSMVDSNKEDMISCQIERVK